VESKNYKLKHTLRAGVRVRIKSESEREGENKSTRNFGCLEWWWLGQAAIDGRTEQSGAPPDTVRCASHVTQPFGFRSF
jgi:hypothetical protein